jgi:hypothetical protein
MIPLDPVLVCVWENDRRALAAQVERETQSAFNFSDTNSRYVFVWREDAW